jgi:hypothetical protein
LRSVYKSINQTQSQFNFFTTNQEIPKNIALQAKKGVQECRLIFIIIVMILQVRHFHKVSKGKAFLKIEVVFRLEKLDMKNGLDDKQIEDSIHFLGNTIEN